MSTIKEDTGSAEKVRAPSRFVQARTSEKSRLVVSGLFFVFVFVCSVRNVSPIYNTLFCSFQFSWLKFFVQTHGWRKWNVISGDKYVNFMHNFWPDYQKLLKILTVYEYRNWPLRRFVRRQNSLPKFKCFFTKSSRAIQSTPQNTNNHNKFAFLLTSAMFPSVEVIQGETLLTRTTQIDELPCYFKSRETNHFLLMPWNKACCILLGFLTEPCSGPWEVCIVLFRVTSLPWGSWLSGEYFLKGAVQQ